MVGTRAGDLNLHRSPQLTQHFQTKPEMSMTGTRAGDLNLHRSPQLTQHFQTQPEMSMKGGHKIDAFLEQHRNQHSIPLSQNRREVKVGKDAGTSCDTEINKRRRYEVDLQQQSLQLQMRRTADRARTSSDVNQETSPVGASVSTSQTDKGNEQIYTKTQPFEVRRSPRFLQQNQEQELEHEAGTSNAMEFNQVPMSIPPITIPRILALSEGIHTQNAVRMESDRVPVLNLTTQVYREINQTLRSALSHTTTVVLCQIQNGRIDFFAGPVHVVDGTGKQMATQITPNTESIKALYTDSVGRDFTKKQIPEQCLKSTEMRRTRVHNVDIIITHRSPRFIDQVQRQDEDAVEASRKRKGKAIALYQEQ